jgi:hypothetical protein
VLVTAATLLCVAAHRQNTCACRRVSEPCGTLAPLVAIMPTVSRAWQPLGISQSLLLRRVQPGGRDHALGRNWRSQVYR